MKEVNKRKSLILLTIGVLVLLIVMIGAAYAFFQAQTNGSEDFNINATAGTTDNFTFRMEDLNIGDEAKKIADNHNKDGENENTEIVIEANQQNFVQNGNSIGDGVKATASLIANNYNYTASYSYNLYLNIDQNNFVYTNEEERTPELVMVVKENGKYVEDIAGLTNTKVQVKGEEQPVTGFDITTNKNFIKIASDKAIDANEDTGGKAEDIWEISIIFLNLENDQNANAGKEFNAELSIQTEKINYLNLGNKDYAFYRGTSETDKGYREQIKNVHIVDHIAEENELNRVESWDLSSNSDGSIMGWLVQANEDDTAPYDLYIGYEGELKAKSLAYAFYNMTNLETIDGLEKIDTSNVTNMKWMFYNTKLSTLDLSKWDTSKVTNMAGMFDNMTNLIEIQGIENFKTENVTDMGLMFYGTPLMALDLSNWNTSKVTGMYGMFNSMTNLTEIMGIENFKTGNVTSMEYMFYGTKLNTLDLRGWDTSKVTNMVGMFGNMLNLIKIEGLENLNVSNVKDMTNIFINTTFKSLDLSNWNTSQLLNMRGMFYNMENLTEIKGIENFKTGKVTDMGYVFYGTAISSLDLRNWDTSQATTMFLIFYNMENLTEIKGIENFKTNNVTDMSYMFFNTKIDTLDLGSWDTSQVTNMTGMFGNMENLTEIKGTENFKTGKVTSMEVMFSNTALITLDLNNWDTSQVTNMHGMFYNMKNITEIKGLKDLKVSNVTNMCDIFNGNILSTLDLSNWDTSQVTNMQGMFYLMTNLTEIKGIENFKTSNVTNMWGLFAYTAISTLDLTTWDTSQVETMREMFYDMTNLKEIKGIENFKTGRVTSMEGMLSYTALSTLNLSKWDTSQVTNMILMFYGMTNLTTLDMTNAKFTQVTNYDNMFGNINPDLKVTITGEDNKNWFVDHNILTADYLNVL